MVRRNDRVDRRLRCGRGSLRRLLGKVEVRLWGGVGTGLLVVSCHALQRSGGIGIADSFHTASPAASSTGVAPDDEPCDEL